ncbi:periplasmic heavy metal sensor [Yoonia sp.]|uniref:periplasmic heavy metal sensor n=1 Tax=Yoonia sp. TaxID=2212373 RepID=UPI003F6AE908
MDNDNLTRPGPSRLWRAVLVLSLAFNLAVIGMVLGAGLSGRFGDRPPRSFDFGLGPLARALEPSERRAIGGAMRRDGALRAVDLRGNAQEVIAALRSDPFDPVRLETAMAAQMAQTAMVQRSAQEALLRQITAMSPQRRNVFADRLQQELSHAHDRRDGRSGR